MEVGYRGDEIFGDGERDLITVATYEISELGNDGIFDYCIANYDLDPELVNEMEEILADEDLHYDEDAVEDTVKKLVENLNRLTHKDLKYCLWLCDTPEDVVDSYMDGDDEGYGLSIYNKSEVIIDDLGSKEGALYAYTKEEFDDAYKGNTNDVGDEEMDKEELFESILNSVKEKKEEDITKSFTNSDLKKLFEEISLEEPKSESEEENSEHREAYLIADEDQIYKEDLEYHHAKGGIDIEDVAKKILDKLGNPEKVIITQHKFIDHTDGTTEDEGTRHKVIDLREDTLEEAIYYVFDATAIKDIPVFYADDCTIETRYNPWSSKIEFEAK